MTTEKIVVEKYNPEWKNEFDRIVDFLGEEIEKNSLKIEHIGSTSVEGLSAKPIIDLDIVVEDDKFFVVKELLEEKGYIYEGDLGIEGREAFSCLNITGLMTHHLYVCFKNSKELYRHITFRNYLRENPDLMLEYSKVKEEAAVIYPEDIDKYMEFKSKVIGKIYDKCGLL